MSVVIWNPNAGQKLRGARSALTEESLRELLDRHGIQARIVATQSEEDAKRAVREALAAAHSTIIAAGLTRLIDVGEANGVPFYETASVGLNAAMFATAQHFEDGDYGSPIKVLAVAFRYQPARMVIELDDETVTTRALMVTISNGAYMGVAMTVAPEARLDDGHFDVRVFRRFSKLELLRHLASIAFGRRRYSPNVSTYRSAQVRVTSHRPLPIRADSHDLGTTPLECVSRHAVLRVVVGPEFADGQATESGSA